MCLRLLLAFACFSYGYAIDISSCDTTKSCIINPTGCSVNDSKCLVFTYAWNSSQNIFHMELSGGMGSGKEYVAVAFSPDGLMQNSDLYYCTGVDLKSGAIQKHYDLPRTDSALPANVSKISASTSNGVAMCSFTRAATVAKNISGIMTSFNLLSSNYYVLQAFGNITNGTIHKHPGKGIGRFSSGPYNFTSNAAPTPKPSTSTAPVVVTTHADSGDNITDGCGKTKGCFFSPKSCTPGTSGCMFSSWNYLSKYNIFDFEIIGGGNGQYVAIAFGLTDAMQDADLYYCTQNALFSGAIQEKEKRPFISKAPPAEIFYRTSLVDGSIRCYFRRPSSISKVISGGVNHDFNLAKDNYYFLFATGAAENNGNLTYHGKTRSMTDTKLNFTDNGSASADATPLNINLAKVHACFMLVAWVTLTNVAVLIARHFKPLWRHRSASKKKLWFQLHQGLMINTMMCTLVGFVIAFVAKMGYSSKAGAHPVLGIIVTALVIINPIMAVCRPKPDAENRLLFNWFHRFVGTLARICSTIAIYLGLNLSVLGLPQWLTYLFVGFVATQLLTEMIFEVVSARYGHISSYTGSKEETIEVDRLPLISLLVPGESLKNAVLTIYVVINVGVAATLIAFIILTN